ncbi:pentapeptide repeat-containing protein [Pantoea sp.]|uniref:pentapeptide repeat-containing protein n=1 Tax=Pantoea sp. TaxID=69393 RepID=UPI0031CDD551
MQIIKPTRLSLLSRPYRWQQQNQLGVAAMTLLDMSDTPVLHDEQLLWQRVREEVQSPDGIFDLALPKACAEFLASGFGYRKYLTDEHGCALSIQVGELRKQQRLEIAPHNNAQPAAFHALDFNHADRQALMGKNYDDNWLKNDYPGFARDTDWRVFNQAPADQWWPQRDAMPAGAMWRIEHMHPEHALLQGKLPKWQVRAFITRQRHHETLFEEIAMRATTVHFLPHCQQMLLIWHGNIAINEDDASDVLSLLAALEVAGQPQTLAHYQHIQQLRTEGPDASLRALRDDDLIAAAILAHAPNNNPPAARQPLVENLARWEQQQRQQFDRPALQKGAPLPAANGLDDFQIEHDVAAQFARHEVAAEKNYQQMMARYRQEQQRNATDELDRTDGATHYQQQRAELQANPHLHATNDASLARSEQALLDGYRQTAQHLHAPRRLSLEESARQRQQLLACMAGDKDARGLDFTAADLSGLDLRGIDLENALLDSTDFSHCQLDGADLRGAVLVRAEFHHSSLTHCLFDGANLALAQGWHSDFSDSSFDEVECENIQLEHCRFQRALLSNLFIQQASIQHCDFSHAQLERCDWMDLALSALEFTQAHIANCNLIRCQLKQVNFSQIRAQGLSLVTCEAAAINFDDAQLKQCMFVSDTQLAHARFRRAALTECNLRDAQLQHACFDQAQLENSDFSAADCRHASLQGMRTRDSRFVRTRFDGAQLNGSLLLGADLQKSQLIGCDLSDCNLFRADMSQTLHDSSTCFDGALTDGMKTLPQRQEPRV